MVCLHGRVQLMEDLENLLVDLESNLSALLIDPGDVVMQRGAPGRGQLNWERIEDRALRWGRALPF